MDSIKDVFRSSEKFPEFDKHLKKAEGHISRNVVEITIKMKTIVRKPLMIKNHQASSHKFRQLSHFVSTYLSISVCSYLSIYLSISVCSCLSIYLSISVYPYLSIYLSQSVHIYLSIYLSISVCSYLSIYLTLLISICIYIISVSSYLSIYLSIYLSHSSHIYLYIYLSLCGVIFIVENEAVCISLNAPPWGRCESSSSYE